MYLQYSARTSNRKIQLENKYKPKCKNILVKFNRTLVAVTINNKAPRKFYFFKKLLVFEHLILLHNGKIHEIFKFILVQIPTTFYKKRLNFLRCKVY